jgi:hypothetical protein
MATDVQTQSSVEQLTHYCRTCGHPKELHNLDFRGSPKEAHELYRHGEYVCHDMTGLNSTVHCICVGWNSWT